jgi:hypothetical protein
MSENKKTPSKQKSVKKDPHTGTGVMSYYEGGYGNRSHACTDCGGTGRVYEGGYGMTRCTSC